MYKAKLAIPTSMRDISRPWNLTDNDERQRELELLQHDTATATIAISVLERSLQAIAELSEPAVDEIPEDWLDYWNLETLELVSKIPTLQSFNIAAIEALVQQRQADASPSMIKAVAEYWLQSIIYSIARSTMNWLETALPKDTDPGRKERLISTTARYLLKVDINIAVLLISMVTIIAWHDAVPLLIQIENHPNLPERLREQAKHYHHWVRP
ncbi:MAG: hypothetical protein J2P36_22255 [Ktedonobacteraceae bacterium]|nr:hypothetical protein [Ktedonobacteraceae bacterium]